MKTAYEYELFANMLEEICEQNHILRWWNWWKVRRYHLVPALRGWGWTGTNWAEIGQSHMKKHHRIWLLDAMWEDVLHAIVEADWVNFIPNKGKVIGQGPTLLAKCLNEVRAMWEFGTSAIEAIRSACLLPDIEKHFSQDKNFLPAAWAKHRVPGSYPKNNPTQVAGKGVSKKEPALPLRGRGEGSYRGRGREKGTQRRGRGVWNLPETRNIVGNFDDIDFPPAGGDPLGDIPVYISESDDEPPVQQSAAPGT